MEYLLALVPSIGVGVLFYFIVRAFIRADRNEREAVKRMEAEENDREIRSHEESPGT